MARPVLSKAFFAKVVHLSLILYEGLTRGRFPHVCQSMMNVYE